MTYRNIVVDDMTYQYVIGRTNIKVRGYNAVSNRTFFESLDLPYSDDDDRHPVTPKMVSEYIRLLIKQNT